MAIKRNPYYMRTLDDILPQLSKAKTISMGDATSEYWHVPLDLASSLLTTFSTLPLPAELMNSRTYRTLLPTQTMLKSREEEREELMSLK